MSKENPPRLVIIDDDPITCKRLKTALSKDDYEVHTFTKGLPALRFIEENFCNLVISDIRLPDIDGLILLDELHKICSALPVILITGYASIPGAVEATKKGAYYYLPKPFNLKDLRALIKKALRESEGLEICEERLKIKQRRYFAGLIGESSAMKNLFNKILKIAPLDCNVLIEGESGTGKELIARAIHYLSPRKDNPFVAFNCGALSEDLAANELFGHEKEAFTGAVSKRIGLLEAANEGTLFLDEVGECPSSLQVKLLRVLQERQFYRLGGTKPVAIDVRIIAATNRDLRKMVESGQFREDLFFRLNVVNIKVPPLRERKEDIPALVLHFLDKYNQKFKKDVQKVSPDFIKVLLNYSFPGNVRELENIIEQAVALCDKKTLEISELPPDLKLIGKTQPDIKFLPLKEYEKQYIRSILYLTGFNQKEAAKILGISRTTLWRKMKELNLS
ncbi:two component, sigma54 specific, transcriptional regulator, Fis family [Thermodesulfatator indicus DSM 15286]|uniref:Two component, sigma54 specific, transcriptional regulator, Fis family n=1 Tax=Thermodesulfatator indicus (strain DSM 15286 / JCM 11887 / CIR29812) TaxID=667014 RepID=F8AD39_THEID|nr:sigma-54 dependent transcriptional regulator [Thermodesulfatator indicus]AEH45912.1 two component, sigma54 specific, transcriptional regulator, Fis family [Thermodesulfatator indicus DSM 15286]